MTDDSWSPLRRHTSARIALGRTGDALPTRRLLEFQLAHARARDAVHQPLDVAAVREALSDLGPVVVESLAETRAVYLQRPDYGRRLAAHCRDLLPRRSCDVALVLADGLSARAVHESGPALVRALTEAGSGLVFSPPVIARQARVALGDDIAAALGADLAVVLIGERPGLSAADSLGAYVTYRPRPGETRDAERNCVSNIRPAGLPVPQAARLILALALAARRLCLTGVGLKEDDAVAMLPNGGAGLRIAGA